jgi:DNA-binding MarR family transcriptional regulator
MAPAEAPTMTPPKGYASLLRDASSQVDAGRITTMELDVLHCLLHFCDRHPAGNRVIIAYEDLAARLQLGQATIGAALRRLADGDYLELLFKRRDADRLLYVYRLWSSAERRARQVARTDGAAEPGRRTGKAPGAASLVEVQRRTLATFRAFQAAEAEEAARLAREAEAARAGRARAARAKP